MVGMTTTLSAVALGLFVQQSIRLHFIEQEADELRVMAESVEESIVRAVPRHEGESLAKELAGAVAGHHGVYFLVADSRNSPIYSSPGPDLLSIAGSIEKVSYIGSENLHSWQENENRYSGAVLTVSVSDPSLTNPTDYTVVVAAAMDDHFEFLAGFNRTLWSTIFGISLFAVLAAWIAARQAHAPIHELSAKISSISSDSLDDRLDESEVPTELIELVTSFNTMIIRIEEVFQKLSNFSADLAHEFRTPITNTITQTQVALNKPRTTDEYQEILFSNLEEYERMARMVGDMLFLAQTENGLIIPTFEHLDLSSEVTSLFEYFEAWAEDKQVTLRLSGSAPPVMGDRSMLRRALSNLISNAIDHSEKHKSVSLTLQHKDDSIVVDVCNDGTTILKEQLSKIFDRFYQADPSRSREGAGLGLAIVKSIVELHKGKVVVFSEDGTTRFRITIPHTTSEAAIEIV